MTENLAATRPAMLPRTDARPDRLTLLVTSAGRRVGLLEAFRAGAAQAGVMLEVLACDLSPDWSAACHLADRRFAVPRGTDPAYADAVLALCREWRVGLVVPTIDPELEPLSIARPRFAAIGAQVAVSDPAVVRIARDKLATAELLARLGVPTPRSAPLAEVRADPGDWAWPLIVKPRHGSASRAVRIVDRPRDLGTDDREPMMAQALLCGQEWTVNLFVDASGVMRTAVPHHRVRVRAGEVEKGVTARMPLLESFARRIVDGLPGARGALCFQAMVAPDGSASVFEINARFGGGYPLADRAGAPFARWLVEGCCGLPDTAADDWQSGLTMLRYDHAIFR